MKVLLLTVVLLIAMTGCGGKKTTGPGPNPGPKYQLPSSPSIVLSNLALAYSSRDSMEYAALFDSAYAGISTDQSDGSVLNFTKADETHHVNALARRTSISAVRLQLPPVVERFTDGADPAGWATVHFAPGSGFDVQIDDTPSSLYMSSNSANEFKFAPRTPSAGSPTDTTWKVIRWIETR
ncbi:MAG: hypothetical protein E6K71_00100 [Candidatus Eisenbacteria bacterium]|uniref:Uncharacterized protein n=1 Tax=Eiseniibacteriota bacterium TaxID=2212470 RepID=A0A538SJP7_UNCEI|nr:MAG: hypothetical protein E6K71_00100 [Candidatus Eisenbacteria bacterium]